MVSGPCPSRLELTGSEELWRVLEGWPTHFTQQMRINQLQCAQYGLGIGKQHRILTPVPKCVLQRTVADVTMPLLQEQQCILGELLLNTSLLNLLHLPHPEQLLHLLRSL